MQNVSKSRSKTSVNLLLFCILFLSFFEYIFLYTELLSLKFHMVIVSIIFIVLFAIGLKGNIKPAFIWLPFYLVIIFQWFLTRFSTYYLLIYISIIFLPSFCFFITEKNIKNVIKTIQIFSIFFAIGCLFQQFFNDAYLTIVPSFFSTEFRASLLDWNYYGTYSGFSYQPTAAAAAITIGIIVSWLFMKNNKKILIVQFILYFALILTAKRSFLLISVLVPLFIYYFSHTKQSRIVRIILIAVLVVFLIYTYNSMATNSDYLIFERMNKLFAENRDMEEATSNRTVLIDNAVELFKINPLFGIGFGNFAKKYGTSAHNVYLQLLCETGIIGFLTFIIPAIVLLLLNIKKLNQANYEGEDKLKMQFSLGMQLCFLFYAFLGNPLYNTQWIYLYFLACAMVLTTKPEMQGGGL